MIYYIINNLILVNISNLFLLSKNILNYILKIKILKYLFYNKYKLLFKIIYFLYYVYIYIFVKYLYYVILYVCIFIKI